MTNNKFYLSLNITNILLCVYMYATLFICFIFFCMDCIDEKCIFSLSVIWSIIIIKFFVLYILFKFIKKFFPNFVLSKVAESLKSDKIARKKALLLAIAYDIAIIVLFVVFFSIREHIDGWNNNHSNFFNFYYALAYELLSVGGVLTFYLSTFCLWKIEDKIKEFYNKKTIKKRNI